MRCKREVAVCCMLLLCASLAWAGDKPVQTPSNSFAVQQALHEEPAPTVQKLNERNCYQPTNSAAEAVQMLERDQLRLTYKGARATGDDCSDPIAVTLGAGDLPYVTSDTTCGRYNDYSTTCLGYYDGGEDIIYELTLTEALCLQISVDGVGTWVGVGIDDVCPLGDPCIAFATDSAGNPSMEVDLGAGTYYLMIDTWPSPTCTDFTLTIDACPPPCEVPCPGGATMEGEPDCYDDSVDNFNGGCNSSPYVFSDISCDETICGKSGTFLYGGSNYRDTDWYRLELTMPQEITWTAKAEFPVLIFIIDAGSENCADYTILSNTTGAECVEISLSATVGSGVYWLWIGPSVFEGVPCDGIGSHYVATLTCEDPPPCVVEYSVAAPGNWTGTTCGGGNDCGLRPSEEHMYEVSIPNAGMWTFSLCGSSFDTYLYIGETCCGQEVGYNDDYCGVQSEITAFVSAGTYYVDIEAYGSTTCGAYVLDISEAIGPDNDFCQDATDAGTLQDCVPVVIEGDNTGATQDCYALGPEAWIKFTIPSGEVMDVSVAYCGTSPPFLNGYIVMDQSCPCSGSFIYAANWNNTECGDGNYTLYWEELPAGLYYWPILTDAYYDAEGPYTVTIHGTACVPCDVVCDPDATPEGEPLCGPNYVDNYNGGCNSSPAVFSPIWCGETVCGESGTYLYYGSSYRDTDWYAFELFQEATVTWEVVAEFDLLIFLIDGGSGNCTDYAILTYTTANDCDVASISYSCDPGLYWVWVGPSVFSGVECGKEYEGTLYVDPPEACTPVGACCLPDCTCVITNEENCLAQDGAYQGDDTECAEPPPPPPPECVDPDATITVEIMTDAWGYETSWELVENGYGVVATGGGYGSYSYYIHNIDVCSPSCYTWTIFDAYGDGIYGPGGYTISYEGVIVADTMGSGWYGSSETVEDIGGGCGGGEPAEPCVDPDAVLTVEILTDYWGSETTWELTEVGVGVVASGGPYADQTYYIHDIDVCSTSCYSWTIFDAWGDGIYAPGGYTISWNGVVVASTMGSGWSGDEQTVGGMGDCGGCTDPDTTITVEIFTDNYPNETTWALVEIGVGAVATGGPYSYAGTLYTHVIDVCSTSCYNWTIYDSWGDGICCSYGYGYYNVYYGGELVGSGGVFGSSDTIEEIGLGCMPPLGACHIGHCGECVETTEACCINCGGTWTEWGTTCETNPPPPCAELDLKPTSCPNSFNRGSHGVLPVALLSSEDVDVMDVDISTIRLIRDDLVGGEVPPHEGPPGPHTEYADVGMPFDNEGCDCIEGGPDGIVDISMKFQTDMVVDMLELDSWPAGTMVPLVIKGNLLDGSPFATYVDCLRLVPAAGGPAQIRVRSNHRWCWVGVTPMDATLDMGGFPEFTRAYDNGIVVTLTATQTVPERPFMGWKVDGVLKTTNRTVRVTADGTVDVEAIYGRAAGQPGSPQGQRGAVSRP